MGRPMTELSLLEAAQSQYFTRHLPNGLIVFADQRYEERQKAFAVHMLYNVHIYRYMC